MGFDLLQNLAILLLSINLKDAPSYHKDLYSTLLIAAVFIIARTWKQTRCPSTEEWIKEIWYFYTMGNYSALKNDISLPLDSRLEPRATLPAESCPTPARVHTGLPTGP